MSGAANAFFTLRVGGIAKRYCMGLKPRDKRRIRREATREASKALAPIVTAGTKKISSALWRGSKDKAAGAVDGLRKYARGTLLGREEKEAAVDDEPATRE